MNTYRIRGGNCPYSILIDASSAEEAELFGALYYLIHGLVDDLSGPFTSEAWNASVEVGEYVPHDFFANIAPQLETLIVSARAGNAFAERRRREASNGRVVQLTVNR